MWGLKPKPQSELPFPLRYSTLWLKFKRHEPSSKPSHAGIYVLYILFHVNNLEISDGINPASCITNRAREEVEVRKRDPVVTGAGRGRSEMSPRVTGHPGQSLGRAGVFELFIFIIIASPSIYNNYHLRPSLWFGRHMGLGVCWSVIIGNVVISHLQCSHLAQSLFWPGLKWLLRVGRLGPG